MPVDFVLLKTDALFFALIVLAFGYALYARPREHLRAPWRQVARSRRAMAAGVVLGFFVLIAALDSIHFHPHLPDVEGASQARYATEIVSAFDTFVGPLRTHVEKTYSAPFATHLYAKEAIEIAPGRTIRDYPRLKFGGAHLEAPEHDRGWDILAGAVRGGLAGLGLWLLLCAGLTWRLAAAADRGFQRQLQRVLRAETEVPWLAILGVLGVLCIGIGVCVVLSSKYHVLGTDKVGTDVFYQTLKSIRTGLIIGTLTTLMMLPFAVLLGTMAGYFRGWVDDVIQYLYTTLSSIPGVLLIAAAALMLDVYMARHASDFTSLAARADMRLLALCIILGITSWTGLCRLLRGEALKLREIDFVQAAQVFGVSHGRIIVRHLLPNVMHIVMITIVLDFSNLVLAEAVLSYINIGVDPSMESWGNMINSARLELAREPVVWWSLAAAFVFMFTLVLAANLFADAVRDAFDPRLRTVMV